MCPIPANKGIIKHTTIRLARATFIQNCLQWPDYLFPCSVRLSAGTAEGTTLLACTHTISLHLIKEEVGGYDSLFRVQTELIRHHCTVYTRQRWSTVVWQCHIQLFHRHNFTFKPPWSLPGLNNTSVTFITQRHERSEYNWDNNLFVPPSWPVRTYVYKYI